MADRVDVGTLRRAQIVEAATRVIARKGFHNATLAEVEAEAGISRGMMTYHFPSKHAMIEAVFEATIERLKASIEPTATGLSPLERVSSTIDAAVNRTASDDEFFCLLHTFLAQAPHRPDYRIQLASAHHAMRQRFAKDLEDAGHSKSSAASLAMILVAALHGLAVQSQSDPEAFERNAFAELLKALVHQPSR